MVSPKTDNVIDIEFVLHIVFIYKVYDTISHNLLQYLENTDSKDSSR